MKYEAITGAAQHSITAIIFQRPGDRAPALGAVERLARRRHRMHGQAERLVSRGGHGGTAAGGDELEPDIEDDDEGREAEPLECVAVVLFDAQRGRRPVALQAFGGRAGLLQRHVGAQRQPGLGAERFEVEILPDGRRPRGRACCGRRAAAAEAPAQARRASACPAPAGAPAAARSGRHLDQAGRRLDRLQLACGRRNCAGSSRAAPSPSARLPSSAKRRQHVEAGHAVHLAVVEVDRLRRQPEAAQVHRAVHARRSRLPSARKACWSSGGQLLLRVDLGLQRFFLRRARQLPAAERHGGREASARRPAVTSQKRPARRRRRGVCSGCAFTAGGGAGGR